MLRLLRRACLTLIVVGLFGLTVTGVAIAQGLVPLADSCDDEPLAGLELHNGFQESPRCVDTQFGAVAAADKNPTLLITDAPLLKRTGEGFSLKISTRNLIRDRFLAAGQGGYYIESAVLNGDNITRGHVHVACRNIGRNAPPSEPAPAFFRAIEDGGGGPGVSNFRVGIPGNAVQRGTLQCAAWAGDGSHRTPMMTRANQIPAFDSVDVRVIGRGERE